MQPRRLQHTSFARSLRATRPLTEGEEVVADDTYLFNSIVDPNSQIVEGYEAVMPTYYADQLDEQQITDLVEYIKSLAG